MSTVELLEAQGDPLPLVLLAILLSLLCVAWACGVPQLLHDLHRRGMARVRADSGRPLRVPLWLRARQHDHSDTDTEGNRW